MVLYERSPIKHTLGITLGYDEAGRAVLSMPYRRDYDNAMGNTHGGVIATLLDKAGWFTAAQHYATWIATADLHVQVLASADKVALTAIGQLVRAGRRLAVATSEVRAPDGTLIAIGSGTFAVTSRPFSLTDTDLPST